MKLAFQIYKPLSLIHLKTSSFKGKEIKKRCRFKVVKLLMKPRKSMKMRANLKLLNHQTKLKEKLVLKTRILKLAFLSLREKDLLETQKKRKSLNISLTEVTK